MSMGYITYFDLLGTRGFCDNSELYYNNIHRFNKAVSQTASILLPYGNVGVFSDSAYAESTKLEVLLKFLILLRNRLMSDGLFFNAIVKKGNLGIKSLTENASNVFGVAFQNSEIADLYIAQANFKGVGIFVDSSIEDPEIEAVGYAVSNCVYMGRSDNHYGEKYVPIAYRDISLKNSIKNNGRYWDNVIEIFLCAFYESYVKAPKFGAYYISLFSNFIRSFGTELEWDMKKKEFYNAPTIFNVIDKMVTSEYGKLQDLPGLDCLVLIMLDMAYGSEGLTEYDKDSITKKFAEVDCIKKKYFHDLNCLPQNIFRSSSGVNYRDKFIRYCQEDSADNFVNSVLSV